MATRAPHRNEATRLSQGLPDGKSDTIAPNRKNERVVAPPPDAAHPATGIPVGNGPRTTASRAGNARLIRGDCRDVLNRMDAASVHMVLTDPPYFLDGLDSGWAKGTIPARVNGSVGGLPIGMKFDPRQGRALQDFLSPVFEETRRVLKPGGFMLVFSAPRLYHRMAVAAEDCGFEIRDLYAWHFHQRAQFKAFTLDHFVRRRTDVGESEKATILKALGGRKTPQLRPQFEAILCAQNPREGTFVNNWLAHGTGLIDASQTLDGKAPATVLPVEKENRKTGHLTPKPARLCEHLIRLFTKEGQTVLDPFVGSGTSCVAARNTGRHSIGIDVNHDYIEMARRRLEDEP